MYWKPQTVITIHWAICQRVFWINSVFVPNVILKLRLGIKHVLLLGQLNLFYCSIWKNLQYKILSKISSHTEQIHVFILLHCRILKMSFFQIPHFLNKWWWHYPLRKRNSFYLWRKGWRTSPKAHDCMVSVIGYSQLTNCHSKCAGKECQMPWPNETSAHEHAVEKI